MKINFFLADDDGTIPHDILVLPYGPLGGIPEHLEHLTWRNTATITTDDILLAASAQFIEASIARDGYAILHLRPHISEPGSALVNDKLTRPVVIPRWSVNVLPGAFRQETNKMEYLLFLPLAIGAVAAAALYRERHLNQMRSFDILDRRRPEPNYTEIGPFP